MSTSPRKWPDFEYTGQGTVAGNYLRSFWQPVYISADLPSGKARPLKIMGQTYTIYRGESGEAHVIADRCLHRGTLLSTGTVEGEQLRCFYHGWKYDSNGQCVERPAERTCPATLRAKAYPTREWAGMVFAYLGEGGPPAFPALKVLSGEGYLTAQALRRPFNYFNQLENGLDEVHFNFVHRVSRFAKQGLTLEIPVLSCEETEYGLSRVSVRGGVERRTHFLMPNVNVTLLFDAWHVVWRVPVDDVSHISFTVDYFEGSPEEIARYREERAKEASEIAAARPATEIVGEILAGRMDVQDVTDHPDLLSVQDGVALAGQGVIAERHHEVLGLSDNHIIRMRRLWAEDLGALQEGRERRAWRWPEELDISSGVLQDSA